MSMKAVKWFATKGKLELVQVPAPCKPKPDHVIVQVAFAGVCGTDIHITHKAFPSEKEVILGHEFSGTIVTVGEGVSSVKVGDHVAVNPLLPCYFCNLCARGRPNLCHQEKAGLFAFLGVFKDGGWAEFCEAPAASVVILPEGLSLKQAVLSEPLSSIVNGFRKNGQIPVDARILVMGAGIAGIMWSSLLHYNGFRDITITNRSQIRAKIASDLGLGFQVYHPDELAKKFSNDKSIAENGFDLIIDATGNPEAVEKSFFWLRHAGKMNVYGCFPPGSEMKVDPSLITLKEISIIGTFTNCHSFSDSIQLLRHMSNSYFNFEKIGIKVYKLEQYQEALEALFKKEITKAVFHFSP